MKKYLLFSFVLIVFCISTSKGATITPDSLQHLKQLAEQGYARAQCNLGNCYYYGKGVTKDYSQAVYWYRKSAEQGNAPAQYNLGYCYYYGQGVTKDYSQAVYWYRKSAEQGYDIAQYNLGVCYENGQGVPKERTQAISWYRKAANQGYNSAKGRLNRLLNPTSDDIKTNGGYASAVELKDGGTKYWKVSKGGRYGLTDAEGKVIVPTEMESLESAGTGYLRYKLNGFWGLMNYAGRIIIDTDRGYTSIGDFKTFNKRFSYTMAGYKGECDVTGRQVSKIKVETPPQQQVVVDKEETPQKKEIIIKHDPIPVQQWQACWACGGMGTMGCDNCGGSGTKYIGDRLHICSRCNGRGIIPCNICYGNKGQYITVYQ